MAHVTVEAEVVEGVGSVAGVLRALVDWLEAHDEFSGIVITLVGGRRGVAVGAKDDGVAREDGI